MHGFPFGGIFVAYEVGCYLMRRTTDVQSTRSLFQMTSVCDKSILMKQLFEKLVVTSKDVQRTYSHFNVRTLGFKRPFLFVLLNNLIQQYFVTDERMQKEPLQKLCTGEGCTLPKN